MPSRNKGKFIGRGEDGEYKTFSTEIPEEHCVKCHEQIQPGDFVYSLNYGTERKNRSVTEYLRFTGIIWHRRCLDISKLPGLETRDGLEDEIFNGQIRFSAGSRMTH